MAKILVVDDSIFVRNLVSEFLVAKKYEVSQCANGDEAIEKVNSENPDLVLMDIVMENKDGISTMREILDSDSNVNVVIMSAMDNDEMIEEAKKSGSVDFLSKPFSEKDLLSVVKKNLK